MDFSRNEFLVFNIFLSEKKWIVEYEYFGSSIHKTKNCLANCAIQRLLRPYFTKSFAQSYKF